MVASNRKYKLLYADVSRAYFYAPAAQPVYVQLPEEDRSSGDEGKWGKLRASVDGSRDAAMNWATEYGETLKAAGYVQGKTSPCLFFHRGKNVTVMVHMDDFVAVGDPDDLESSKAALSHKYKIKTEVLGGAAKDANKVSILNTMVRMTDAGLSSRLILDTRSWSSEISVSRSVVPVESLGRKRPRKNLSTA